MRMKNQWNNQKGLKHSHYELSGASVFTKKSLASLLVQELLLESSVLILNRERITPTISLSSTPPNFQEIVTLTVFDGYMGIQSTNEMDVCCPNHSC